MGLLLPGALLFAGLFVPVIIMYFIRQRREPVVLPSIALWARFVQERTQAARFDRFRHNPLLWLQLLLMLALVIALARPFRRGAHAPGQATVIVLDASASMQTREADGRTRFAQAKAEIADAIRALGGGDQMMLIAAGPRPRVVQGLTADARAVQRALRDWQCSDGTGDVVAAIRTAAQAAGPGTPPVIRVWTDGAGRALEGAEGLPVPVEWHPVGESRQNVGITALAVRRRPDSPLDLEVFASVVNLGDQHQQAALRLTLDDALLYYDTRRLAPGATVLLTEPILAGRSGVVRLHVDAQDALETDNTAAIVLAPQQTLRVLVVTSGNTLLERTLRLFPGTDVRVASPRTVQLHTADADLVVLDRWVPARWPRVPTLVFGPPAGASFPGATAVVSPSLTSWRREHPLLRHLTFADVHVSRGLVQPAGRGVTPLVSTAAGGVIWTQHGGGTRQIVVGFALSDSDWILRPAFPLFLANVLDDLRDEGGVQVGAAVHVGESLRVRVPTAVDDVVVRYPDGTERAGEVRDGFCTVDDTWGAGVYTLAGGGWSESHAINLLNADESHITPQALPEDDERLALRAGVGITREYWPWLLLAALLIGLIEWAVYHRRAT